MKDWEIPPQHNIPTTRNRFNLKTVVIVTHRPAAFEICDRVLRFTEKGVEERKDRGGDRLG